MIFYSDDVRSADDSPNHVVSSEQYHLHFVDKRLPQPCSVSSDKLESSSELTLPERLIFMATAQAHDVHDHLQVFPPRAGHRLSAGFLYSRPVDHWSREGHGKEGEQLLADGGQTGVYVAVQGLREEDLGTKRGRREGVCVCVVLPPLGLAFCVSNGHLKPSPFISFVTSSSGIAEEEMDVPEVVDARAAAGEAADSSHAGGKTRYCSCRGIRSDGRGGGSDGAGGGGGGAPHQAFSELRQGALRRRRHPNRLSRILGTSSSLFFRFLGFSGSEEGTAGFEGAGKAAGLGEGAQRPAASEHDAAVHASSGESSGEAPTNTLISPPPPPPPSYVMYRRLTSRLRHIGKLLRSDRSSSRLLDEDVDGEVASAGEQRPSRWMDRWIASRSSFDNRASSRARASVGYRDPIKTLEIDTARPYSYSAPANPRRQTPPSPQPVPLHRYQTHSPTTPSPSEMRPLQVRSASPRCGRQDHGSSISTAQTPTYHPAASVPNYMAATESAKARLRSQSAPRQRPGTPDRDRTSSAKKRLSFPEPENLRSPSFKSAAARFAGEPRSNVSSSCNDSLMGEASPSSTTDLRRWLRGVGLGDAKAINSCGGRQRHGWEVCEEESEMRRGWVVGSAVRGLGSFSGDGKSWEGRSHVFGFCAMAHRSPCCGKGAGNSS
ncbi:hypothetical protein B296_00007608 [Ensete ventricosum]|uniref:DUF4005 domain-containing protein n=1 Tax=Ensete ventricosum TaxID=4639 RepID=A0A427B1B4_ENSVE|nr:hypothetical protein B296_00007608 [Ensete ventricosum]